MMSQRFLGSLVVAAACLGAGQLEPAAAQQFDGQYYSQVNQPYPNPSYYPWAYGMYGGFGASYAPYYSYPNFSYPNGGLGTYGPYVYGGGSGGFGGYGGGLGGYGGGSGGCCGF